MSEPSEASLEREINAAFREAAADIIKRAKQTGTRIVIWEDGRVKAVSPRAMEARLKKRARKKSGTDPKKSS